MLLTIRIMYPTFFISNFHYASVVLKERKINALEINLSAYIHHFIFRIEYVQT